MRLLEAVNYPPGFSPQGQPSQTYTAGTNGDYTSFPFGTNLGYGSSQNSAAAPNSAFVHPISIAFPQPRLGRVWNVEQLVYTAVYFAAQTASPASTFNLNLTPYLNDVAVGPTTSVLFTVPAALGSTSDRTKTVSPVAVQFYSGVVVTASDQLTLEVALIPNVPAAGVGPISVWINSRLAVIGTNERK